MEIRIYSIIIGVSEALPRIKMKSSDSTMSRCCRHICLMLSDLTLRENMGMGATSRADSTNDNAMMAVGEEVKIWNHLAKGLSKPRISPTMNMALAGVGSPMNDTVCRVSILNFANRRAEKMATAKGITSRV